VVVGVVCGDHVINCCRCLLCTKSLAVLLGRIAEIAAYCCRLSSVVCLSVCLYVLVTFVDSAEPIDMAFGEGTKEPRIG